MGFLMTYSLDDCRPLGQDPTISPVQMTCGDGEYSAIGAIWYFSWLIIILWLILKYLIIYIEIYR